VTQTITVDDTTLPTASDLPTITVNLSADVPTPDINLITDEVDNCTANPVVSFVIDQTDGNYCPETLTRLYSVTDDCGNSITVTQTIIVTPMPSSPIVSNDSTYCGSDELAEMTASGNGGTLTWYSDAALSISLGTGNSFLPTSNIGTQYYYITESNDNCESAPVVIQIDIIPCEIVVPTAFTPNGDGANDSWEIVDIDSYENSIVQVFSRWGTKIFESPKGAYSLTPWDGQYNGEALPVGSYYYIIDLGKDEKLLKGVVSIIKE
jgi:gliding motility-associated-like protein